MNILNAEEGSGRMSRKTCKYKAPGKIPGEGKSVCNNGESGHYEETVNPEDCCGEYKRDWRAGFMRRFERRV